MKESDCYKCIWAEKQGNYVVSCPFSIYSCPTTKGWQNHLKDSKILQNRSTHKMEGGATE